MKTPLKRSTGAEPGVPDVQATPSSGMTGSVVPPRGPGPIAPAPTLAMPKRRRRPALIAVGIILVILGSLGSYYLTQRSAERIAVVGIARDVAWGQPVAAADLVQVQIVQDPSLTPVLWSNVSSVIGQVAAGDLRAGTLLTAKSVTELDIPGAGNALVGVAVGPGQLPVTPLRPRDRVLLVATPEAGAAAATAGAAAVASVPAVVYAIGDPETNGKRTVDVIVPLAVVNQIAAESASGRIAIVLVPQK